MSVPVATGAGVPGAEASAEDQRKVLEDAKGVIKVEAFYMKRCLDSGKLMDALKHASNLASELRTSLLSPKDYYSLYMVAFDELRHLEAYLYEERDKHGKKMSELYELVQYAGNIVPRLYLLVTVASAYIRSREAPVKEILRDTVEMLKGVQHPTRGLFLRNYLSEMTKDKLPDVGTDGADGTVRDSVEFVLNNFAEMNRLWVRLHMGPAREREKREGERQELRILVGKNLSRLSQLEGVDVDMYKTLVLPRILEQVVGCKDRLAQQYIMEIVVQIFPDEFHLATLDQLLSTCERLVPRVDVKSIIASLIDRLSRFIAATPSSIAPESLFLTIESNIQRLATEPVVAQQQVEEPAKTPQATPLAPAAAGPAAKPRLGCSDYLALQACLESLCLKCFPETQSFVDEILGNVDAYLSNLAESGEGDAAKGVSSVQQLTELLSRPVEAYNDALRVLSLTNYAKVSRHLAYERRKTTQVALLRNAIAHEAALKTPDNVTVLLSYAAALVRNEPDQPDAAEVDKEDFEEEQHLVASLVHLCKADSAEALFAMYFVARKFFGVGGKERIRYTLPPLIFAVLKLAVRKAKLTEASTEEQKKFATSMFTFVNETVKALHTQGYAEMALRLHLQAAQAAALCGLETPAYEFVSEAMSIYEDDIAGSAEQFAALTLIVGSLNTMPFTPDGIEGYETLITKTAKHSLKLMRKPDQCRAVCASSHLFWRGQIYADGKRVTECLQKSLKIADSSMSAAVSVELFVEILNQYLYYFEHKNETILVKYLSGLIALINTNIANVDPASPEAATITTFYRNTLAYISARKAQQAAHPEKDQPPYASIEF